MLGVLQTLLTRVESDEPGGDSVGHSVFYSWQSDLPSKTNRGLIRDALDKACKEVERDLELALK